MPPSPVLLDGLLGDWVVGLWYGLDAKDGGLTGFPVIPHMVVLGSIVVLEVVMGFGWVFVLEKWLTTICSCSIVVWFGEEERLDSVEDVAPLYVHWQKNICV
jgi:hypothetical protein